MRFFNTTGPIDPQSHYFLTHRLNESVISQLILEKKYFILHAPRQSGKTTAIKNLVTQINAANQYKALYINVEPAQAMRGDVHKALLVIMTALKRAIRQTFGSHDPGLMFFEKIKNLKNITGDDLEEALSFISEHSDKPFILFIDEIDALTGDTLISVLRQLRSGYLNRPQAFPQSVCLVGLRDVRAYRDSSELEDFSLEQVRELYNQHTQETGQIFDPEAISYAFEQTRGQPWLVNALAYQACFKNVKDRNQPITVEILEKARETLIQRRDTHLDVLIDRLRDKRVQKVISAILMGQQALEFPQDDLSYVVDLGLIRVDKNKNLVISNPIYQEIIPRELTHVIQATMIEQTAWYLNPEGFLDMQKLLENFVVFYRENSEILVSSLGYQEAGPHLLLMAFLQRVINGGGKIHREYALGRRRVDLLVQFKNQRFVIETKIHHGPKTITEGLNQTADYMDKNNSLEGHLMLFDTTSKKSWDEKIFQEVHQIGSQTVRVWGL